MSDGAKQSAKQRHVFIGNHKVVGRAKGTSVSVVKPDRVTVEVGVDGEGVYNDNGDDSATITLSLMPNSDTNDVLSALHTSGLAVPVSLVETNGRTAGGCAHALVVKQADVTWSDGGDVRQWTIVTTNWQGLVGGSRTVEIDTSV